MAVIIDNIILTSFVIANGVFVFTEHVLVREVRLARKTLLVLGLGWLYISLILKIWR